MKTKKIPIVLIGLVLISTTIVAALNLPSQPVTMNVVDGTTSYFISTLSGVPAGYDVENGVYPGWCADRDIYMVRSTNHQVTLSDDYANLPVTFQGQWDKINWILNNKGSHSVLNVQNAFWYLLGDLTWNEISTTSKNIIISANISGVGFEPQSGDIIAIVAIPTGTEAETYCQCSFIEVEIPEEQGGCSLTPGYWKNHAVGKHADPTWAELPQGPSKIFHGNNYGLTWLSVMNFHAKQAKNLGLEWTDVEVYQHLAFHYVAAVLNGLNNGHLPSEIDTLISDAEEIFTNNHNMILDSTETASAKQISSMLADFNEGTLYDNWPHCED